ncbi:MAG: hypothetical protein Kow00104_04030 [Rhodothalassiaceae bacterium]
MMHWRTPPNPDEIAAVLAQACGLPISVKTLLLCGRRFLLLRETGGQWELPGGRLEPGEDPIACLAREIVEETGLSVHIGGLVDYWVRCKADGSRRFVMSFCSETDAIADPSGVRLSSEHQDCLLLDPGAAPPEPILDVYRSTLALGGALIAGSRT